jgi:predicted nucleic acid-binding protein
MQSVHELLDNGPWRRISVPPQWEITKDLSEKYRLRGADLWHLATAKSLCAEFPELRMLTFDDRLKEATVKECIACIE